MPVLLAIAIMTYHTSTQASEPKVERYDDSEFYNSEAADNLWYVVDTAAQLCYFTEVRGGYIQIPCDNLKKRPEWKNIIKW